MGTQGERPEDNVRVIAGRYRLGARLGRGGMGVVWQATDELLARQVAVKELPVDTSLSAEESRLQRERTLREARAVAQLRHPHIIVVHDVVEQDERPYIVMDLLEGGSLADRISRDGPVDAAETARMGIDLLSALRKAHGAGVLHRDLKPGNVLLNLEGRAILTDFGTAQVAGATTLTESGSFVGSPEYTAPERMSGVRTGPESDLWSLGALLCTALSGESPFRRDSLSGILHAVVVLSLIHISEPTRLGMYTRPRPPPPCSPSSSASWNATPNGGSTRWRRNGCCGRSSPRATCRRSRPAACGAVLTPPGTATARPDRPSRSRRYGSRCGRPSSSPPPCATR
ncbi:serine/threonine-protein kinase [Streptomyces apricus]|uniref:serine/threonine-protein kinase n=1 Tax=Streptomyces apricus TaxID=1828112 RepID=UPI0038B5C762